MKFCVLLLIAALLAVISNALESIQSLPFNADERLSRHILLYHGDAICAERFQGMELLERDIYSIDNAELAAKYFPESHQCAAVCLERGTHVDHIFHPLDYQRIIDSNDFDADINSNCQFAEVGFLSYLPKTGTVYWLDENGKRFEIGPLVPGERNTFWIQSYLGHRFAIVDHNGELVKEFTVEYNTIMPIGSYASHVQERKDDVKQIVRSTFESEWQRSNRVQRTFTEFGFAKGRLPTDIFASMAAFYYNNKDQATIEEWEGKGVFVNWWEKDVYFVSMPFKLKKHWQGRLKTLVEEWVGVPLDLTDIYGMRRYEDGARLLTHVDREATHATSLIVNVAQGNIRKPWHIEIYDFAHRLHEIEMNPGDIVFYESARCLHGRMQPLEGAYYVNLFAHYRPQGGDTQWYAKQNPVGTTPQALDLGNCAVQGNKVHCDKYDAPTLSPKLETLHGPEDLYRFWDQTTPAKITDRSEL